MKLAQVILSLTLLLGITQTGFAADPPTTDATHGGKPEWLKYTVPGEGHKILKDMVGTWKYTMKWWATADAKPVESKGTSKARTLYGDRYLEETVTGKAMGEKFTGTSITGFDAFKEVYQTVWFDNMGTGMSMTEGTYDAGTKTLAQTGSASDPMSGEKNKTFRTEAKFTSKKEHTFAMYSKGADGKEFKTLEINYTR